MYSIAVVYSLHVSLQLLLYWFLPACIYTVYMYMCANGAILL